MKNRPKSWKAVLDKRRKENFIGRAEHLRVFTENFTRELPDYMIFSVTGEGGVGKSTLLSQFSNIVKQQNANAIIVTSDDRHAVPALVMGHIAAELAKSDISHREFDERYKKYREIREEIESDPNAPRGAIDLLARVGTDFFIKSARKLPGAAPLLDNIDEKATSETISQLVQYGITKWSNKDERSLLLETDRILTPLFLDLLAKVSEKQMLVLMFDVFERTSQSLSRWLLQLFNFEYGDFDTNLTFVIAGRDSLEQHWTELAGSICHIALEPFTLDETRLYLANQGITNESLTAQIYEDTSGLPVLVELLAATKPQPGMPLPDVSKDAVERFLQWVPQEDRRRVALVAAVLRQFNRDILTALLGDEATNAFNWLSTQSFVHVDRERGWCYHEKVRELMLRHLRNTTPKDLDDAHSQLAEYFEKEQAALDLGSEAAYENEIWRKAECERIYHTLSTQSEPNKTEVVNAFFHGFRFHSSFAAKLTLASKQVGREKSVKSLSNLAAVLSDLYSAYNADDYQVEIDKLNVLKSQNGLTVIAKSAIHARLGYAYRQVDNKDQSLASLNCAIELAPTYVGAIINRGITHLAMDRYIEALEDFSRSIELDPNSIAAVACRGLTYRLMNKYEEALIYFNRVISMDDKSARALEDRAETYRMMGKYEEALADFNQAVELGTP